MVVGVLVVVPVGVDVGVWLEVAVRIVAVGVNDAVGVWVMYTTRVEEGSGVDVPEG